MQVVIKRKYRRASFRKLPITTPKRLPPVAKFSKRYNVPRKIRKIAKARRIARKALKISTDLPPAKIRLLKKYFPRKWKKMVRFLNTERARVYHSRIAAARRRSPAAVRHEQELFHRAQQRSNSVREPNVSKKELLKINFVRSWKDLWRIANEDRKPLTPRRRERRSTRRQERRRSEPSRPRRHHSRRAPRTPRVKGYRRQSLPIFVRQDPSKVSYSIHQDIKAKHADITPAHDLAIKQTVLDNSRVVAIKAHHKHYDVAKKFRDGIGNAIKGDWGKEE